MVVFRCQQVRCQQVAWQFQTPIRFRAVKQRLYNPGIRSWKALMWLSSMSESQLLWYLFQKEVKNWDYLTWFRIWQLQTPSLKAVSSNASPSWTVFFFSGLVIGVFWKRESRHIEWHQSHLLTRHRFFCLHAHCLWCILVYIWAVVARDPHKFRVTAVKYWTTWRSWAWLRYIYPRSTLCYHVAQISTINHQRDNWHLVSYLFLGV
jgi:hypothetical protein